MPAKYYLIEAVLIVPINNPYQSILYLAMCLERQVYFYCGHFTLNLVGCGHQQTTNCHPPHCPRYRVVVMCETRVCIECWRETSKLKSGPPAEGSSG